MFENWGLKTKAGLWVLSLPDKQVKELLQTTAYDYSQGQISPDAKFVAYTSNESTREEVYVQHVVPVGVREEDVVDVVRREAALCQLVHE